MNVSEQPGAVLRRATGTARNHRDAVLATARKMADQRMVDQETAPQVGPDQPQQPGA